MTWSLVQTNGAENNVVAFPGPVTSGNLLIVAVDSDVEGGGVSDNLGHTWTPLGTPIHTDDDQYLAWWYAIALTSGTPTVTYSGSGSFRAIIVAEFATDSGSLTLVEATNQELVSGGTAFSSPAATAVNPGSLFLGAAGSDNGSTGDYSAVSPGAIAVQQAFSGTDRLGLQWFEQGPGTDTVDWTSANPFSGAVGIAVFGGGIQQIRPDADIATTGWATAPLWSKVDESSPDGTVITATAS